MKAQTAFIGSKPGGGGRWILPYGWRRRWQSTGGRVIRQATDAELAAFCAGWGLGTRPVRLDVVMRDAELASAALAAKGKDRAPGVAAEVPKRAVKAKRVRTRAIQRKGA